MIYAGYLSEVSEGARFFIAFASLMGFLGLITGFFLFLIEKKKRYAITLIIISIMLMWMTGIYTGLKYFRI
jgi:hypothetical protein